jgi:hypothetical protein
MAERACKAPHVLRRGERDDGDPTPGCVNLFGMCTKLGQVLLAEETAEMAEEYQNGGTPEHLACVEVVARHIAQFEIELDSRHRDLG